MDTMQFYEKVNRMLKDRLNRIDEALISGTPTTLEDYKGLVQARRELQTTQDEIQAIYSRATHEDDDDDQSPIIR